MADQGRARDLWGADADAVAAVAGALAGHHPERGGQELEQAAFAVVQALRPVLREEAIREAASTLRHIDCAFEIHADLLPARNPTWDAANYIERKLLGPPDRHGEPESFLTVEDKPETNQRIYRHKGCRQIAYFGGSYPNTSWVVPLDDSLFPDQAECPECVQVLPCRRADMKSLEGPSE